MNNEQKYYENELDARMAYNKYLTNHIINVKRVYVEHFAPIIANDIVYKTELRILNHDRSKYDNDEYTPYRKNFFPIHKLEKLNNLSDFENAVNIHYNKNSHHWQHWCMVCGNDIIRTLDMDESSIIEMLCDWGSFKYVDPNESAHKYYEDNGKHMVLSDKTRDTIEKYLDICKYL